MWSSVNTRLLVIMAAQGGNSSVKASRRIPLNRISSENGATISSIADVAYMLHSLSRFLMIDGSSRNLLAHQFRIVLNVLAKIIQVSSGFNGIKVDMYRCVANSPIVPTISELIPEAYTMFFTALDMYCVNAISKTMSNMNINSFVISSSLPFMW